MVFISEGKRARLSLTQRSEIWRRWKAGQTLHEIGRAFGKPHSCIRCLLLPRGGIPPKARRRSRLALTRAEREDTSRGIASGSSIREIARHLDRAASTVSLEISTAQLVLLQNPKAPSREQNGSTKSEFPRASQHDLGWRAPRTTPLLPVARRVFSLDSPVHRTRLPEMWIPGGRWRHELRDQNFRDVDQITLYHL
jgi:hypothetical protein